MGAFFAWAVVWLATGHLAIQTSRNSVADVDDPEQDTSRLFRQAFMAHGSDA